MVRGIFAEAVDDSGIMNQRTSHHDGFDHLLSALFARPPALDHEHNIVMASSSLDVDFSQYDLDVPVPHDIVAGGHTSARAAWTLAARPSRLPKR